MRGKPAARPMRDRGSTHWGVEGCLIVSEGVTGRRAGGKGQEIDDHIDTLGHPD